MATLNPSSLPRYSQAPPPFSILCFRLFFLDFITALSSFTSGFFFFSLFSLDAFFLFIGNVPISSSVWISVVWMPSTFCVVAAISARTPRTIIISVEKNHFTDRINITYLLDRQSASLVLGLRLCLFNKSSFLLESYFHGKQILRKNILFYI